MHWRHVKSLATVARERWLIMDVFITGGSGYVGGYVLAALIQAGHRVHALARSSSSAQRVEALGAEAVLGDVTGTGDWQEHARRASAIIHLACPSPGSHRRFHEWTPLSTRWVQLVRDTERRALPLLFEAARANPRLVTLLTTTGPAAAGDHEDSWIDEDARGPTSIFGEVQQMIEDSTLEAARAGVPAAVIRPGAVYGPDGGFGSRVLRGAQHGRVVFVGDGNNYLSWVHIEDYANAYLHALSGAANGYAVAIVDDAPTRSRDAMALLASMAGAPPPRSVPKLVARIAAGPVVVGWATQSARLKNQRAKRLLGWSPRFSSVREGFASVLAGMPH
jgi:nucleoside-diphosphate-sugar epimerase